MNMPKVVKIGDEEYEEIPREAMAASKIVADMHMKLGRPTDPLSVSGQKLMKIMIAVWEDLWPKDANKWYADRSDYQSSELSVKEQVQKKTGRSLASFPYPLYQMMKSVFKGYDPSERNNCMKLVKVFPMFRMANKV